MRLGGGRGLSASASFALNIRLFMLTYITREGGKREGGGRGRGRIERDTYIRFEGNVAGTSHTQAKTRSLQHSHPKHKY